jgi:restriction system protein
VLHEGAIKGILVTTAEFGPGAQEFAAGKPLTLIGGTQLADLLSRNGIADQSQPRGRHAAPAPGT